jgi:hypothetical protein
MKNKLGVQICNNIHFGVNSIDISKFNNIKIYRRIINHNRFGLSLYINNN